MAEPLIALSTGCFYRESLLEVLGPMRDAGFGVVEVSTAPTHLDPLGAGRG